MLTLSANALASDPRELRWADLVPEAPVIENPFGALTPKQLRNLMIAGGINGRHKTRGRQLSIGAATHRSAENATP